MEHRGSPGGPERATADFATVSTRRDFISTTATAGGALLTGLAFAGCRPPVAGVRGDPRAGRRQIGTLRFEEEGTAPTDAPFGAELDGRLFTDLSSLTPETSVIPTERFYIRTRASRLIDLRRPWSIRIGTQSQLETLSVKDLLRRSDPQGLHLMECAGNTRDAHFGMMGAAEWAGVPLNGILAKFRSRNPKSRILVSGFDKYKSASATSVQGCGWVFSAEEISSSGAFIATGMNGRPLTPDHGGPIRLFVPGWYGCACVKWIDKILFVKDDSDATSEMQEYASRTEQTGVPRLARDYEPAVVDPAAMPIRVEKWQSGSGIEYRVSGLHWGGVQPAMDWEIRFAADERYVPVQEVRQRDRGSWGFWTHRWRPRTPGRYTIRLRVATPTVRTRRLDVGFYSRTVDVIEV